MVFVPVRLLKVRNESYVTVGGIFILNKMLKLN